MASRLPYKVQPLVQNILQPVNVGDQGASVYGAVADEAMSLARQLQPAVNAEAAAAGAASVTTDATGNITVGQKLNVNEATAAYNNAAQAAYLTQVAPRVREEVGAAKEAAGFDVEKFRAASSGLVHGFIENAPPQLAASIQNLVARETASAENALIEHKQARDQKMAQGSVLAELGNLEDKLSAYAGQDALATPEAQQTLADYRDLLDTQVANPLFAVSSEMADAQYKNLQSKLMATTAEQKAVKVFNAHGLEAAKSFIKDTIYDPNLALSEQERSHYQSAAESAIRQRQADVRAARADAQSAVADLIGDAEAKAARTGDWRSTVREDQIVAAYGAERGARIVSGLDFQANVYRYGQEVATATPAEVNATLAELDPDISPSAAYQLRGHAGLIERGNIDLDSRPVVTNADGSISTVRSLSVGTDRGELLLPAVSEDGRILSDKEALDAYRKTGKHLGIFDNAADATAYAEGLHDAQSAQYLNASESFGYKRDAARYDAMLKAVNDRQKALNTDPAGYVVQTSPRIQQLWQGATDAGAVQRAAKATMLEQDRIGVPPDKVVPLPVAQASALVSEYLGTEQSQDRAALIGDMAAQYGDMWPQVQQQLVEAGMPAGVAVLGTMVRGGQAIPRASLAEAMAIGPDKLKTVIGDGARDVDRQLSDSMADFDRTLAFQPNGAAVAAQFRKSASVLAYKYVSEGTSPSAAADRAASEVATGQYEFADTYRVPVQYSFPTVDNASRYVLSHLADYNLAPVKSLDPRIAPDQAERLYEGALRSGGYFVTNEDETGLLLVDQQGRPVMTKSGHDLEFTFDDLAASGVNVPSLAVGGANTSFKPPKLRGAK